MKWFNLKRNKCPKCNKDFLDGLVTVVGVLIHEPCGFKIRESRYQEIVSSMVKKDVDREFVDKEIDEYEKNKI